MRLSENDCNILACAYFRGDESISKIAQECDLPQHVVRRSLESLLARGFITRRVYINPFRLGYHEYLLLLATEPDRGRDMGQLLEHFRNAPEVAWMGAIGPNLQYECNVLSRNPAELQKFLERVMGKTPSFRLFKEVLLTQSHTWFVPKFLSQNERTHRTFSCSVFDEPVHTDEIDHKILMQATSSTSASLSQVARDLRLPTSTVAYRFDRLKDLGVVVACGYRISASHLIGMVPVRLRLALTRPLAECRPRVRALCEGSPGVYYASENIGRFDMAIGCRVAHPRDIRPLMESVRQHLGELVGHIESVTDDAVIKQHTHAYSPEHVEKHRVAGGARGQGGKVEPLAASNDG